MKCIAVITAFLAAAVVATPEARPTKNGCNPWCNLRKYECKQGLVSDPTV